MRSCIVLLYGLDSFSRVALGLSFASQTTTARIVWHFAILLSSYTYKVIDHQKSFCGPQGVHGPPVGIHCSRLNEKLFNKTTQKLTASLKEGSRGEFSLLKPRLVNAVTSSGQFNQLKRCSQTRSTRQKPKARLQRRDGSTG